MKNKNEYIKDWMRSNTKQYCIRFNADKDADVIAWLERKTNKVDYVRGLIVEDMKK